MAGQSRRGRSVESWNALTQGNRRRWIRAFATEDAALEAYRNGLSLTSSQRGHATTPERPIRALLQPWKYPKYVGTHTTQLNEVARSRGLKEHGTGPRGESKETQSYTKSGGDFTWVAPKGSVYPPGWHFSHVFTTEPQAQLWSRQSGAAAGYVIIVDNLWNPPEPQPAPTEGIMRWEVWFAATPHKRKKSKKNLVNTHQAYEGEPMTKVETAPTTKTRVPRKVKKATKGIKKPRGRS